MRPSAVLAGLLLAAVGAPARAQGAVLVVDPVSGPFTTISAAIAAAADGDTIYVHQGTYVLNVVGRSLTIAAAPGEIVDTSLGSGEIKDLAASDVLVLRGLRTRGLHLTNCAGTVWFEDCNMIIGVPPLLVESSASVVLMRCNVEGPDAFTDSTGFFHVSSVGAHITDSIVAMFDCTVEGASGENFHVTPLGPVGPSVGEDGIRLESGELRLSGGSVKGGKGGNGPSDPMFGCSGADGGHGVHLTDGGPSLVVHDVAIAGGAGGTAPPTCPSGSPEPGDPGQPILVEGGSVETVHSTARELALDGPVTEQHVVHLEVAGVPGDAVLLLVGLQPGLVPKPAHGGDLLVPAPLLVMPLGVLGDPPQLDLPIGVPELGAGVATVHAFVQGVFKPTTGAAQLGSGSVLIALDSVY